MPTQRANCMLVAHCYAIAHVHRSTVCYTHHTGCGQHNERILMRVWIDTDCGCDDAAALAYLLYHPAVEIVGISTTFGNTSADNVTRNVLTLLDLAGRQGIPVARGADHP